MVDLFGRPPLLMREKKNLLMGKKELLPAWIN
jgi:hypothetical protein